MINFIKTILINFKSVQRGTAAVEFALMAPIFFPLALALLEIARYGKHVDAVDNLAYFLCENAATKYMPFSPAVTNFSALTGTVTYTQRSQLLRNLQSLANNLVYNNLTVQIIYNGISKLGSTTYATPLRIIDQFKGTNAYNYNSVCTWMLNSFLGNEFLPKMVLVQVQYKYVPYFFIAPIASIPALSIRPITRYYTMPCYVSMSHILNNTEKTEYFKFKPTS